MQALETALRNDPGHRLARNNLGEIHLRLALQAWERPPLGPLPTRALQRRSTAGARSRRRPAPR